MDDLRHSNRIAWGRIDMGTFDRIAGEDALTRLIKVHVCISDPVAELALRKLLAANPRVRVTPWRAEHLAQDSFAGNPSFDACGGELPADTDVLLLGPEDLSRFEENAPGRIDDLQRRLKVLLLLRSEDLPDSLEILRHCDGMVVRDINMGNISDIMEFALHGYFVIPYKLRANFMLTNPVTQAAIAEQISLRERGSSTIGGRDFPRDVSTQEYCATRKTMRRAIGKVLNKRKNGARVPPNAATPARAAEEPDLDFTRRGAASPASWRRALRDEDGRITAGEYALLFAALAIWGAIIFDGGAASKIAKSFGWCAAVASSIECGTFARTPVGSAAASLAKAAKRPQGSESDLRTSAGDVSGLEWQYE